MSLLMEALRKAEQAKRKMQQEQEARDAAGVPESPASPFTLEEREPGVTPQYIRDNFTAAQDARDARPNDELAVDDILAEAAELYPLQASRQATQRQQRAAAASVFAAKQKPTRDRKTLTILVTILLLMLPLGGGVLWYLQSMETSSIGLNPALANYDLSSRRSDDASSDTAAAPAAAVAVADADESAAAVAANESANENAEATDATNAADTPTVLAANDEDAAPPAPATTAMLAAADNSATTAAAAPTTPVPAAAATADLALPDTTPAPVLEVSRSRGTPQVNPDLVSAYARLQAGDIGAAGSLYRQVLAALPNNRDALLGLALVHVREGQPANARELYARLLQLNPRDPLAHTGLLQTMQGGSPVEHENALKQLQTQFPNVAQLTLALGNHYAAQGRWSEAQAAYYNALLTARRTSNGPVHPDYAFNLAVSLEQLNQPQAALDYYRQAQALAADVRPGFDLQLLNDRLDYLLLEQGPR